MNHALLKLVQGDARLGELVRRVSRWLFLCSVFATAALIAPASFAQSDPASAQKTFYDQVRSFSLGGGSATVSGLTLNRDRVQMTSTGTFYFCHPGRWPGDGRSLYR
jgi:hypothetical protein